MHTRTDRLSAILIDAIVRNHRPQGLRAAADALARNGIALDVALRVLTRPWLRRHLRTAALDGGRPAPGARRVPSPERAAALPAHRLAPR